MHVHVRAHACVRVCVCVCVCVRCFCAVFTIWILFLYLMVSFYLIQVKFCMIVNYVDYIINILLFKIYFYLLRSRETVTICLNKEP